MSNAAIIADLFGEALLLDRKLDREKWKDDHPYGKLAAYLSDAGKCERAVWYSLKDAPETDPPGIDSLANFAVGHAVERVLTEKFELLGIPVVREVRTEIPWGSVTLSGRADFLIVMEALNCIVELKTTKYRAMRKLLSTEGDENHRKQLQGYMLAGKLGLLKEYGILPEHCDSGVLAYVVKDATKGKTPGSQRVFYTYDVPFDWPEIEATMNDLEIMSLSAQSTEPPPRPRGFQMDKFPCGWCSYAKGCWLGAWSK